MGRLIVLGLIALLVIWWISSRIRRARTPQAVKARREPADRAPAQGAMVPCAHCGVLLPQSEAVVEARLNFCDEAHRRLGPR